MLDGLHRQRLPNFETLHADLGYPRAAVLARALGVTERTARRWMAQGHAPRPALLAMFFCSSWGRSLLHAQAVNDAQLAQGMRAALESENARLRREVSRLAALGDFGSANGPAFDVETPAQLLARRRVSRA